MSKTDEINGQQKPCAIGGGAADMENAQAILYATIDKLRATVDEQRATIDEQRATIDEQRATIDAQRAKASKVAHRVTALERSNKSLRKLAIGEAIGGYGYDPNAARSRITKEIVDDLRLAGVRLDEATVLGHLRSGRELLNEED